jgi:uncharacterized RDD family membrane protein YckC
VDGSDRLLMVVYKSVLFAKLLLIYILDVFMMMKLTTLLYYNGLIIFFFLIINFRKGYEWLIIENKVVSVINSYEN